MTSKKIHVAVLMGGWTPESDVSLESGNEVIKALKELPHYQVTPIELKKDMKLLLGQLTPKPDVVFNALHGEIGEDGCVQGFLEMLEIPYTHSNVLTSALAMDKVASKKIYESCGILTPKSLVANRFDIASRHVMPAPYVVKPIYGGSSLGVFVVQEGDEPPKTDEKEWPFGENMLVEEYIPGRELTVGHMGAKPLGVTELCCHQGFYDYQNKYTEGRTVHKFPAPIPSEVAEEAMGISKKAYEVLGCKGISRSDFRYDEEKGKLYLLEMNTQPGFTPLSLVPEQARYLGISFSELVDWIIMQAVGEKSKAWHVA